jgi:hypothetical protein
MQAFHTQGKTFSLAQGKISSRESPPRNRAEVISG